MQVFYLLHLGQRSVMGRNRSTPYIFSSAFTFVEAGKPPSKSTSSNGYRQNLWSRPSLAIPWFSLSRIMGNTRTKARGDCKTSSKFRSLGTTAQ